MKSLFTMEQETWDYKECLKRSKRIAKDGMGTPYPYRGLISPIGVMYPCYGGTIDYNGGTFRNGEHYRSVRCPLPEIHEDFDFVHSPSWGTFLVVKAKGLQKV